MRYSIEPRIYVKGYGFLSFAKNMSKSLSNKYGQKLLDGAKKSTTDAIKTTSKRVAQKTAEETGDLIQKSLQKNCQMVKQKQINQKTDIYLQKKDNKLLMNYDQYNNIIMEYQKQHIFQKVHQINHLNLEQKNKLK